MDTNVEPPVTFELDEPPTLPQRGPSGGLIKAGVIRSLALQNEAVKIAHKALDELISLLRGAASQPPPPVVR